MKALLKGAQENQIEIENKVRYSNYSIFNLIFFSCRKWLTSVAESLRKVPQLWRRILYRSYNRRIRFRYQTHGKIKEFKRHLLNPASFNWMTLLNSKLLYSFLPPSLSLSLSFCSNWYFQLFRQYLKDYQSPITLPLNKMYFDRGQKPLELLKSNLMYKELILGKIFSFGPENWYHYKDGECWRTKKWKKEMASLLWWRYSRYFLRCFEWIRLQSVEDAKYKEDYDLRNCSRTISQFEMVHKDIYDSLPQQERSLWRKDQESRLNCLLCPLQRRKNYR